MYSRFGNSLCDTCTDDFIKCDATSDDITYDNDINNISVIRCKCYEENNIKKEVGISAKGNQTIV